MRETEAKVDPMFPGRWSPRAFSTDAIADEDLYALFEAARWAPSCFNEQPWLFAYAKNDEDRARYLSALVPANQVWAERAPVLLFIAAKRRFALDDRDNRHAPFDAGAAWMSLALQAHQRGLITHAMAGFDLPSAYQVTGIAEADYDILAAVAIGKVGEPASLPEKLQKMEAPNARKALSEVAIEGTLKANN